MENEEKRIGAAEPAGLSSGEVSRRIEQGLVNVTKDSGRKRPARSSRAIS